MQILTLSIMGRSVSTQEWVKPGVTASINVDGRSVYFIKVHLGQAVSSWHCGICHASCGSCQVMYRSALASERLGAILHVNVFASMAMF